MGTKPSAGVLLEELLEAQENKTHHASKHTTLFYLHNTLEILQFNANIKMLAL